MHTYIHIFIYIYLYVGNFLMHSRAQKFPICASVIPIYVYMHMHTHSHTYIRNNTQKISITSVCYVCVYIHMHTHSHTHTFATRRKKSVFKIEKMFSTGYGQSRKKKKHLHAGMHARFTFLFWRAKYGNGKSTKNVPPHHGATP